MTAYRRRVSDEVTAIRWTGKNRDGVLTWFAQWSADEPTIDEMAWPVVAIFHSDSDLIVAPGSWLVVTRLDDNENRLEVLDDDDFRAEYVAVKP